jgi:hypothetical protein
MSDATREALVRLRAELDHLEREMGADPACVNRARKLATQGKLKHPEYVAVWTDYGDVGVTRNDPGESEFMWRVIFRPDGRFELTVNTSMSSDGRVSRVLKALGEIHRR